MRKLCGTIFAASVCVAWADDANMDLKRPVRTHAFKAPAKMEMLCPGEVKPQGWLRDWCITARNGYISRMDEIDQAFPRAWNRDFHPRGQYLDWKDPDKGAWCTEGGAYWFEGLVRLAWELDDDELKAYAKKRLEPLLERMNPNAIGFVYWMDRNDPAQMAEIEEANHGFIVGASGRTTRAMLAYYEATGDERALRALTWCLDDPRFHFFGNPITLPAAACDTWRYNGDANIAKAIDNFCAAEPRPHKWPAMRYGLPVCHEALSMSKRHDSEGSAPWDWRLQHGVLCYESMLSWVKASLWTGDGKYLANVRAWLDLHERVCRQPHGVIVSDEQFDWSGPNRGTETCTVAGDILLYATLAGATGEGRFADHVERSFFNAGAACTSRDFMRHVYFQSPNRTTGIGNFPNGPGGNGGLYKTKHWPLCCTAALTRILPGYVQWMWMKPATGGLAATLYAPNTLETKLDGTAVRIDTKTDYPFNEMLEMRVSTAKPLKFPLKLRVPEWCANPSVVMSGNALNLPVRADGFVVIDREWKTGDIVSLRFPMAPKVEPMRDFNDGGKPYCSLSCGPLLFACGLPEKNDNEAKPGVRTDWRLDSSSVISDARVVRRPMPAKWDWPLDAPMRLSVKSSDGERLELVPYGCAKLRISMFPDDAGKTVACGLAHALPYLHGVTDKDPLSYAVGEDIVFTVSLEGAESFPDGVAATWRRSGDDGVEEKGTWDGRAPLTVKTKLKRAGFVRLTVEPRQTADGRAWHVKGTDVDVFFDGGAGAGVKTLVQSKPEPKDFDAFWKTCRDELDAVPVKADLEEIPSPTAGVRLYKAKVTCPGGTGFTTGYLSVPDGEKKFMAVASFFGYQFSWTKGAYMPPSSVPTTEIHFFVSAHGFELGREPAYYQSFREAAGSNGFGHGFDPRQNAKPETCYFHGMALRVMRAVEYLKTRAEWNGLNLVVAGGSQGSLQAMWCAAFVPGVTEAKIFIPWLCDLGGTTGGRNHGDWFPTWAPGLDYFDQVNVAKRVPKTCRVEISRIGLGDYIAPPCGAAIMYRSLKCPKSVVWVQGSTHVYVPPKPQNVSWKN